VGGHDGWVEREEEVGVVEDEERSSGGGCGEWGDGAGDGGLDVCDREGLEGMVTWRALCCTRRAVRGACGW